MWFCSIPRDADKSHVQEALPNVLIEAMASGCPVIATNCSGGIQEILGSNGEWGIISSKMSELSDKPSDNLDEEELELARDIKSLLENEILRINLKENGKERATFFSMEKSIASYNQLLHHLYLERVSIRKSSK